MAVLDIDLLSLSNEVLPVSYLRLKTTACRLKVLFFTLRRAFKINLAVFKEHSISRTSLVQRPSFKGKFEAGGQLPVLISRVFKME
ncbi:hypothetical protein J3R30DRAFT_3559707 [Lentinula aciculospora]|uniref:Uncharacterized protein n=1 Tax=Lentinula aciculospora TaxID=153920 RepID=A0A9W8ZVK6_9AGAR|nr:hypothetical protein J3R30DRAFT_3559707 [Lentinula aciculospora]